MKTTTTTTLHPLTCQPCQAARLERDLRAAPALCQAYPAAAERAAVAFLGGLDMLHAIHAAQVSK